MATQTGGRRPFPAVVIVSLLFLACLFGQQWIAPKLPGISGLATLKPGLTVLDIPIRLPFAIDLILVPALFILSYTFVILIASAGRDLGHRLGAVLSGTFLLLICLTVGALAGYAAHTWLPWRILKGIESLGIDADLSAGFGPVHLHGDVISVIALAVGLAFFFGRIKKTPEAKQPVPLTREQRQTPYQRMLQDRREQNAPKPARPAPKLVDKKPVVQPLRSACSNHPLLTLEPEAVSYRPM